MKVKNSFSKQTHPSKSPACFLNMLCFASPHACGLYFCSPQLSPSSRPAHPLRSSLLHGQGLRACLSPWYCCLWVPVPFIWQLRCSVLMLFIFLCTVAYPQLPDYKMPQYENYIFKIGRLWLMYTPYHIYNRY